MHLNWEASYIAMMYLSQGIVFVSLIAPHILYAQDDVLGCGGFVKNNNAGAELDLTQVKVSGSQW